VQQYQQLQIEHVSGFFLNAEPSSFPPLEASSSFSYIIVFFFKEERPSREFEGEQFNNSIEHTILQAHYSPHQDF
jgi:hypothetical protein